jgi:hypothetical protein
MSLSPISLASSKSFWPENQFGPTIAGSFFFFISPAPAQFPSGPNSLASPPGHAVYMAHFGPAHPVFIPFLQSHPARRRRLRQSPCATALPLYRLTFPCSPPMKENQPAPCPLHIPDFSSLFSPPHLPITYVFNSLH